eukprot:11497823-Prorocentrum_lima.AAC.1
MAMIEYDNVADAILANSTFRDLPDDKKALNGSTIYGGPLRPKEQLKQGSRATVAYRFLQSKFPDASDKIERDFNNATIYFEKAPLLRLRGEEIISLCSVWPPALGLESDVITCLLYTSDAADDM